MPHSVPLTLQQATTDTCLCQRLLDTHGQVWISLLWGHFSFVLCSGVHKFLFVAPKSLFPQSCVNSGSSIVGLMETSSKRAYVIPSLLHQEPLSLQQTTADLYLCRRHSNTVLAQSLWGLWVWCLQGLFEPSECLWWVWSLILNAIFPLLPFCWGFSFALWCGVSFLVGSNILLLTVVQQWVVILEFLQEKMSTHPSTLPSSSIYLLPETFWLILIF